MPYNKQHVVVEGLVYVPPEEGDHPAFPIYIPIPPPPDGGLHPEHPIYFPVGIWGGADEEFPTPPIFIPVPDPDHPHVELPIYYPIVIGPPVDGDAHPEHPIELPPPLDLTEDEKEKLLAFLHGNLPPFDPPDYVGPVKR